MATLDVYVDEKLVRIEIPPFVLEGGGEFFDRMDRDMDRGWQMSRQWVENPNVVERCQIVADRLLDAIHNEDEQVRLMMAGYILSRLPEVRAVRLNTGGEVQETEFS